MLWTVFVLNAAALSSAEPEIKITELSKTAFTAFMKIPGTKMRRKFSGLTHRHGVHRPWHQRLDRVAHWSWRFCILQLLSTPELEMWKQKDRNNKRPAHVREAHGTTLQAMELSGEKVVKFREHMQKKNGKRMQKESTSWIAGGLPVSHLSMLVSGLSLA